MLEALQKLKEQNVRPESGKNRWTTVMLDNGIRVQIGVSRPLRRAVLPAGGHHRRRPDPNFAIAEIRMIGDLLFGRR